MSQTNELTPKQAAECRLNYPPGTRILLEHMDDTSYEEKGVKDNRVKPTYRYVLKCESCGREVLRQKKCAVVEHPEHYRCECGGKLIRIL